MSGNGGFKRKVYTDDGWDRQVVPMTDAVASGMLYVESTINYWLNRGYTLKKMSGGCAYFEKWVGKLTHREV